MYEPTCVTDRLRMQTHIELQCFVPNSTAVSTYRIHLKYLFRDLNMRECINNR